MSTKTYTGAGKVSASDYKYIKVTGKTRNGSPVIIELPRAICTSNPDWNFQEKNDVVPQIVFEGVYDDAKLAAGDRTEPWKMTCDDGLTGNNVIISGAALVHIGSSASDAQPVGLSRGGAQFVVERTFRAINADDDPGYVEGRVDYEEAKPKVTINALQWLSKVDKLYAGIKEAQADA